MKNSAQKIKNTLPKAVSLKGVGNSNISKKQLRREERKGKGGAKTPKKDISASLLD